jgi:hypothetical protein
MQMQFWIHACDLSQEDRDNCKSYSCLYALKQLVKPDTRRAYESLGMGSESDLDGFSRLYDVCRHQSRDVATKKPKVVVTHSWTTNLLALKTYRDIHGHLRVPRRCFVPTDDMRWPFNTRDMKLGNVIHYLRDRKNSLSQNQLHVLEELGFVWGIYHHKNRLKLSALKVYKDIHGHVRVPARFVVPTDDARWPIEMHGMKLGFSVTELRRRKMSHSQNVLDALAELGFDWGLPRQKSWERNLLALKIYKDIYGHVRVPKRFVVPTDDQR